MRRRVGPVGLDRDDREAVPLDQPPRDRGAGAVNSDVPWLASPSRTTRASAKRSNMRRERRIVDLGQRLGGVGDQLGQRPRPAPRAGVGLAMRADQRHEAHRAEILAARIVPSLVRGHLDQRSATAAGSPTGITSRPPGLQLVEQRLRAHGCRWRRRGSRRTAPPRAAQRCRRPRRSGHCRSRAAPSAPRRARPARGGARSRSPRRRSGPITAAA